MNVTLIVTKTKLPNESRKESVIWKNRVKPAAAAFGVYFTKISILAVVIAGILIIWHGGIGSTEKYEQELMKASLQESGVVIHENINADTALGVLWMQQNFGPAAAELASMYPAQTLWVYNTFGDTELLHRVMKAHGPANAKVVNIIYHFYQNESLLFKVEDKVSQTFSAIGHLFYMLWTEQKWDTSGFENMEDLTPELNALTALIKIDELGESFIGRFVMHDDGSIETHAGEMIFSITKEVFVGAILDLEGKLRLGEEITASDILLATLEVAVLGYGAYKVVAFATPGKGVVFSIKAVKGGKTAGRVISFIGRTLVRAPKTLIKSGWAKVGLMGVGGYFLIYNRNALNAGMGAFAEQIGWPAWLIQVIGWYIVVVVLLIPLKPFIWTVNKFLSMSLKIRRKKPRTA